MSALQQDDCYVHGGIRHLEIAVIAMQPLDPVHGGIRHLEILQLIEQKLMVFMAAYAI